MTAEQKAEAYDMAIEGIQEILSSGQDYIKMSRLKLRLQGIFPELAESDDWKIRKWLINLVKNHIKCLEDKIKEQLSNGQVYSGELSKAQVSLAWLEKQNEQTLVDNVEPKFKVGDWVVWDNRIPCRINDIYQGKESLMYTVTDTNNMTRSYSVKGFDNNAHLWAIEDAKDGDVLAAHECIVLFKEIDGLNIKCHCTYHFMNNPSFYVNTLQNKSAFHPATKEQRNLLFQKMEEAGYMWDYEKKELKKIEQMSALKEENEYRVKDIIYFLDTAKKHYASTVELDACINWLKSLRTQNKYTYNPYKEVVESIAEMCKRYDKVTDLQDFYNNVNVKCKDAKEYDSLFPQNTWKPSDEQMQALSDAGNSFRQFEEGHKILWSLYYDLKKLREE